MVGLGTVLALAASTAADVGPAVAQLVPGPLERMQRKQIKAMLQGWARDYPGRIESLATSLKNVVPSHLADARLFDFVGLTQQTVVEEGDTAFDPIELPTTARAETVRLFRPGDAAD